MSDIGKLQRPEATAMDASDLGGERELPSPEDPAAAHERAGGELKFRASGGAGGVAPMQRLMDERRAIGWQLAARVQRKGDGAAAGNVAIPESGGSKLPGSVRAKMEPKLGADLSDVNVHTGGESAQAASGLGARAFTVGNDVHFNAGEFAPGSKEGDRLLAHELTHVVQGKKSGVQRKADDAGGEHGAENAGAEVSHPDEPAEKEADAVADGVADQLHDGGDKKGAKGKGKDDKKKKGKDQDGAHGAGEHADAAEGHGEGPQGGGEHGHGGGEHGAAGGEHGLAGGEQGAAGAAPAERPAPISAKFVGVGRKIFRSPKPAPQNATPTGPKKPANDAEYQALPGWADFKGNCTSIGVDVGMALGFWKSCMDQLFTNDEQVKKIGGDAKAILAYVDSAGARAGFSQFADAMFAKFPLDMNKEYALWSGKNAYQFAQGAGCQVLEGTQLGSLFNNVTTAFSKNWSVMQGLWRAISDAYARKIAPIMAGKNLKVFHRKKGDIFAAVESKAIKEIADKTKTSIKFEFHALLVPGIYNFEAGYDGTPNNDQARKDVTDAAGGDEKKAKQSCEGKVKIFDFPGGAPPAAMQDLGGVVGNEDGSLARLDANNADVTSKLDAIKKTLTSKKKP